MKRVTRLSQPPSVSQSDLKHIPRTKVPKLSQDNSRRSSTSSTSTRASSGPRGSPIPHAVPLSPRLGCHINTERDEQIPQIIRRAKSTRSKLTSILPTQLAPKDSSLQDQMDVLEVSTSTNIGPSTVTWDCETNVVTDQQVQTYYEKPTYTKSTESVDTTGKSPSSSPGQVKSYGKMFTKTVTITYTTTIASTEILKPGEEGYEESIERHRAQQQSCQFISDSPIITEPESIKDEYDQDWESSSVHSSSYVDLYNSEDADMSVTKIEQEE